jgi:hypothetical protein
MTRTLPKRIPLFSLMRSMELMAVVVGILVLGVQAALAQGASSAPSDAPAIYRLTPNSTFQQGCFPPCLCPILLAGGFRGTFVLTPTGFDGLFNTYGVTDVNWTATVGDKEVRITGSGTYKVGGEVAVQQQLALDLTVGANPVQHFDSGLVSGGSQFPDIAVPVSLHGQQCFDTVLVVDASPVPAEQIHPYALLPESTFQQGCFPPCRCAIWAPRPISGTFALVDLRQDPLFTEFAVVNVDWLAGPFAGASDWNGVPVRGFGTYRIGGEFAVEQQLSLDLRVGESSPIRVDSGLTVGGGEFPRIDILTSVHGRVCFDTVIDLHALPTDAMASPARRGPVNSWRSTVADDAQEQRVRVARLSGEVASLAPWLEVDDSQVGNCMALAGAGFVDRVNSLR